MLTTTRHGLIMAAMLTFAAVSSADDTPQHERHELMEGVRDAAKPLGAMLQGKADYDADVAMTSLITWRDAGERFGDLFPEGSDTGEGTEAAPAIWEDREGFDAALAKWIADTKAAIEAAPQTLDDGRPLIGAAFQNCKACHDKYRIEDE